MKKYLFNAGCIAFVFLASSFWLPGCEDHMGPGEKYNPREAAKKKAAFDKEILAAIDEMMKEMRAAPMTKDPDLDFAYMMIEHHTGGIAVSDIELKYGMHAEALALGRKTKEGNQASKERLEAFIAAHGDPVPTPEMEHMQFMKEMEEGMQEMEKMLKNWPRTIDADYDFAEVMSRHHMGAIEMSEMELEFGKDETARKEAQMIIDESKKEIMELRAFQKEHGKPVL